MNQPLMLLLCLLLSACGGALPPQLSMPAPIRGDGRFELRYNPCSCQPDRAESSYALELRQGAYWERIALDLENSTGPALLSLFKSTPSARYLINGRLGVEHTWGERGHRFPLLELSEEAQPERLTTINELPLLKPAMEPSPPSEEPQPPAFDEAEGSQGRDAMETSPAPATAEQE